LKNISKNKNLPDDNLLLAGLKRGEERVYRQLFDKYYRQLVVFANRMLGDVDQARSVVQDVFVMIYDKRDEMNFHTSLNSHLYQTVRNRCLNIIKHDKMKREHHQKIFDASDETEEPSSTLEYDELEAMINAAIKELPTQCQKIFVMSRFEGQSNQEIAEVLDLSKRTVETQISKALKRIREELARHQMLPPLMVLLLLLAV
jgi:RNA polymerase sigma-70 factor (family 1)